MCSAPRFKEPDDVKEIEVNLYRVYYVDKSKNNRVYEESEHDTLEQAKKGLRSFIEKTKNPFISEAMIRVEFLNGYEDFVQEDGCYFVYEEDGEDVNNDKWVEV